VRANPEFQNPGTYKIGLANWVEELYKSFILASGNWKAMESNCIPQVLYE
jgi:hypothetical protein